MGGGVDECSRKYSCQEVSKLKVNQYVVFLGIFDVDYRVT
jgi:hypothetical protein